MTAEEALSPPRRVLIIKPSALGDVVTALPVLRGLKRTFPDCKVSWLINDNCADMIEHDGQLDEIVLFRRKAMGKAWRSIRAIGLTISFLWRLRKARYDWVIDLQGLLRSGIFARATGAKVRAGFASAREGAAWFYNHRVAPESQHTVDRNIELARSLGLDARSEDMNLEVAPEGKQFADQFLADNGLGAGEFLVCVPPTRWETKLYPSRYWRRVISALVEKTTVVLLGGPGDAELCREAIGDAGDRAINLAGQTDIRQFVAVTASCGGVVCCDSAAALIAPAVGLRSVVMIGPTRPERTGPYRDGTAIIADVACRGCLKKHCRHISCMQLISPDDVIDAAKTMIAETSSGGERNF